MCRRASRGSRQRIFHLPKGFNQSWPARASRSIGYRNNRQHFTVSPHHTSSRTISTTISASNLSGQAFIRSRRLAAFPVTGWRTGCACSVSVSKTSPDYKFCCPRNEPSFWIPRSRTPTIGVLGFGTAPTRLLLLQSRPLAQLLELTNPQRIGSLSKVTQQGFLYAKVGSEDAFAFPDVAPGSIVRVNPRVADEFLLHEKRSGSGRLYLIEHSKGFCCCSIRPVADGVIVPVGTSLPYAQGELRLPTEAKVLGVVDLEIRPLLKMEPPKVPKDLARRWKPQPLKEEPSLGERLQRTRTKMNLSLREVAMMSHRIANILDDAQYCISASSLCDYEQSNKPPRDFHKVITLCSLYGFQFYPFLNTIGVAHNDAGAQPIPDHLMPRIARGSVVENSGDQQADTGFLEQLVEQFQEVPLFLLKSFDWLSTSANIALDDFFWIGGERDPLYSCLTNGLLALVNRRRKTAFHFASRPLWQQPIYVILKRDGTYLAASCGTENGTLVIHPYGQDFHPPMSFRNHQDAEIVGQIVAVARRLP
jgi:transcriptional regulator with XRE-family HTH domain